MSETRRIRNGERLLDLVRYKRHALHEDNLITDEEYAELCSVGPGSARRLENYDVITARSEALVKAVEAECAKFKFPDEDRPELWAALQEYKK